MIYLNAGGGSCGHAHKMGERIFLTMAVGFGIVVPLAFIVAAVLVLIIEMPLLAYLPLSR